MNFMFWDAASDPTAAMGTVGTLTMILPMVIVLLMMYLVLYRPQKKQQKKGC